MGVKGIFKDAEIEISDEMAEFIDTIMIEGKYTPKVKRVEKKQIELSSGEVMEVDKNIYDESTYETMCNIRDKTQDLGDNILVDWLTPKSAWTWERTDFDFCYTKKVIKVEDRQVFMESNRGKLFAIPMNDYLYMMDRVIANDVVEVTKFHNGRSYVTRIVEKYAETEKGKRDLLKQKIKSMELSGLTDNDEYRVACQKLEELEEEHKKEVERQLKEFEDIFGGY